MNLLSAEIYYCLSSSFCPIFIEGLLCRNGLTVVSGTGMGNSKITEILSVPGSTVKLQVIWVSNFKRKEKMFSFKQIDNRKLDF